MRHATLVAVTAPPDLLRHAGAVLLALTVAWPSYLVSCRLLPDAAPSARIAATWLGMAVLKVGLFLVTTAAGQFAFAPLGAATLLLSVLATWRWGAWGTTRARQDVAGVTGAWHALGWWRAAAVLVALPVLLRLARALISPPLAWDALTYHLPRAVEWVQHGTLSPLPGPDASAYYTHFPPYGDAYFAWALVAAQTDAWLFAVAAWTWAGVWLGGYSLARTLGATRAAATAAAFAGACLPAVASFVSAAYVDNAALGTLLVAVTFALRLLATWRVPDALVAGAAFGLLTGIKSSAFPVVAAVAVWIGASAIGRRAPGTRRACAVAAVAAAALAAPPLVRAFAETGNPLYPLDVSIGAVLHLEGDPQLTAMMRTGAVDPRAVLRSLFAWTPWSPEYDPLGLGPASLALIALAAVATVSAGRHGLASTGLLLAVAGAVVLPTFADSVRALWAYWTPATARFLAPAVSLAAALAARVAPPWLLWGLTAMSALCALPRGIGPAEWHGLFDAWPALAGSSAVLLVAWRLARTGRLALATATGAVLAALLPAAVGSVRAGLRMAVYEEAARGEAFDLHRLARAEAGAWPLWRQLETRTPTRLALAAGFTGPGHNWYRYPLYGARLQHTVHYVPVTRDGALRSYLDEGLEADACQRCWLTRLEAARIDALVVVPPPSFEVAWARSLPERFVEVPGMGTATAFLVQAPPGR